MRIRTEIVITGATVLIVLLVAVVGAYADTLHVPTEAYPTIQAALDVASGGDVIQVSSLYANTDSFPIHVTKSNITLRGAGMGLTVLDAGGTKSDPTTRVISIEGVSNFTLEGFTIQGGSVTYPEEDDDYDGCWDYDDYLSVGNGGGIYCYDSTDVKISQCEICNNYAKGTWAARHGEGSNINWYCVWGSDGSCIPGRAGGGGIYLRFCKDTDTKTATVTITECLIHDNQTEMGGGGICTNYAPPEVRHCSIYNNKACQGGGLYWFDYIRGDEHPNQIIAHILFNDLIFGNTIQQPAYWGCEEDEGEHDPWTDDQGGGVYLSSWGMNQTFEIYSTTVADNAGYEVYISHKCNNPIINGANDIIWPDDDEEGHGKQGFHDDGFNGSANLTYSDIWWHDGTTNGVEYPGPGNILVNPNFQTRSSVVTEKYFLDQTLTKPNGPVNAGDNTAYHALSLVDSVYSTDERDSATYRDLGTVDMGFHYGFHSVSYVQLVSFTANAGLKDILLSWETGTEIDNAGFVIYRSDAGLQDYRCISGLIGAEGTAASGASYAFVDEDVEQGGHYEYWLVDIDTNGKWTAHGPAFAKVPVLVEPVRIERELVDWRAIR